MNKSIRAIGSFTAIAPNHDSALHPCPRGVVSYGYFKASTSRLPTSADSLTPWEGTPEGDKRLEQVMDENSSVGKAKFPSQATEKADLSKIFRR
jgi:hypothetical protein